MNRSDVVALVDAVVGLDVRTADRAAVSEGLAAVERVVAWCDARRLACAGRLAELTAVPELVIAEAGRVGARDAERVMTRAGTAQAAPEFAGALEDGRIAAGHLDQLTTSLRRLPAAQRAGLLADSDRLVDAAARTTPEQFGRILRREEARLSDDDGAARLERQQAAVRLHRRVDIDTGMHVWSLWVDPLASVCLENRLRAATEALFHDTAPVGCPSDPLEKQAFLRAHALLGLLDGRSGAGRMGRPEVTAVIDITVPGAEPIVDWGLPVDIPHSVLQRLWPAADIGAVLVAGGAILHTPGVVDLGRTTRLANRAQRRALRALYPTCALPGCAARYDTCTIHHVTWWRHGGATDLANLLPVCSRHHHLIHDGGWHLHLAPDRTLTVTHPDGTVMSTGPPSRHAA